MNTKKFVGLFGHGRPAPDSGGTRRRAAERPQGHQGPDVRKQESKGTEAPDVRKKATSG